MDRRSPSRMSWLLALAYALPAHAGLEGRPAAHGGAPPPRTVSAGELWEQVRETTFQGQTFTNRSVRCLPKGDGSRVPVDGDDRCRITDTAHSGSRWTWRVACEDGSSGTGEATRTGDTMRATMHVTVRQPTAGELTTSIQGRRVGGECDPDAARAEIQEQARRIQQLAAQSRDAVARSCHEMALQTNPGLFLNEQCASEKPVFCASAATPSGFEKLVDLPEATRDDALARCGTTQEQLRASLCAARAREIQPVESEAVASALDFIAVHCPEQGRGIAQRECSGRSFTGRNAVPGWVYAFCQGYASQALRPGGDTADLPSGEPTAKKRSRRRAPSTAAAAGTPDPSATSRPADDEDLPSGATTAPPLRKPSPAAERSMGDEVVDELKKHAAQEAVDQVQKRAKRLFGF